MERARHPIQQEFESLPGYGCFACSSPHRNPLGLNLIFEETENGALTRFNIRKEFQSYYNFVHGGIVSTILDETMVYSIVLKRHLLPFTRHLHISLRKGVAIGKHYVCEATIVNDLHIRAVIREEGGAAHARAESEFVVPTFSMACKMMDIEPAKLEPFRGFFLPSS